MAKTLTEMISDIRLDLKDSGALWSDAELTRSVKRAVSDLSRFLPLEMSYDYTVDYTVSGEAFTTPAATSDTYIVNAYSLNGISSGQTATLTGNQPDLPRPMKITITDADSSITKLTLIVKGNDADGRYIEEEFYLSMGKVQTGVKHFKRIIEVQIDEIAGNAASDTLSIGKGATAGVWVPLANKPIRYGSESVSGLSRDTDYIMDYINGRIAMKSGGSMADATAYSISYDKNRVSVNFSNLTNVIRINRVEYPSNNIPQTFVVFSVWGKFIVLNGEGPANQEETTNKQHATVYYYSEHTPPHSSSPGSFPSFLDSTIEQAAGAYALFMKAIQMEHQAVTDLASSRTELGYTTAVHALILAALAKVSTHVAEASTALDKVTANATGTGSAKTALDKVPTYLETYSNDNALYWLTKITTDIAALRTAINTAVDAANAYADAVTTISLDKGTTGAEAYLDTGDSSIVTVNNAEQVAEKYAAYANARVSIASARIQATVSYIQEAQTRLANLQSYIQQSGGWANIAQTFVSEASQRLGIANSFIAEATQRIYLSGSFIQEAQTEVQQIAQYLSKAQQYQQIIQNDLAVADKFRADATDKRNEAWAIWRDPSQYIGSTNLSSVTQPGRFA